MNTETLELVKPPHRFVLTYEVGREQEALDTLVAMVRDKRLSFDWFDAAVMSHKIGHNLSAELKTYINPNNAV